MNVALSKPNPLRKPKALDLEPIRIELARARIMARAWSETIPETRRTGHAARFARAASAKQK